MERSLTVRPFFLLFDLLLLLYLLMDDRRIRSPLRSRFVEFIFYIKPSLLSSPVVLSHFS